MKFFSRRNVALVIIPVLILMLFILYILHPPPPPERELRDAREALSVASLSGAEQYAPEIIKQAGNYYDSAMSYLASENKKWPGLRNYQQVCRFAGLSVQEAGRAVKKSALGKEKLYDDLEAGIQLLVERTEWYRPLLNNLPVPEDLRKCHTRGCMLLSEAREAFQRDDLIIAGVKFREAMVNTTPAQNYVMKMLSSYFTGYQRWKDLTADALNHSLRTRTTLIVIDKYARKCFLYKSGRQVFAFDAELGKNWIGDKLHAGDKATPEGLYHIRTKKSGIKTKYHKALLLDYPNEDDRSRYELARKKGEIPEKRNIGGSIEIHGGGGFGFDWTDGCIAMSDQNMDRLYENTDEGTPVVIVGSLHRLNEIYPWYEKVRF